MTAIGDAIRAAILRIPEGKQADEDACRRAVELLVDSVMPSIAADISASLAESRQSQRGFVDRNEARWKAGFDALETVMVVSLDAGMQFQKEFLAHAELQNDVLLGVLMRMHARACRVAGEILVLMRNGYAEGALVRWRTLHELAVSALAINKVGKAAAIDYFLSGKVKALEGMEKYQACAERMNYLPYPEEVVRQSTDHVQALLSEHGRSRGTYSGNFGWARPHIESGHFEKLQSFVGLEHWEHEYKWASQDLHCGYREMRAQLGMTEAKEDLLLVGPSNSGMTEPGHRTALSLIQITSAFLTACIEDASSPLDPAASAFWVALLDRLARRVGEAFLSCEGEPPSKP